MKNTPADKPFEYSLPIELAIQERIAVALERIANALSGTDDDGNDRLTLFNLLTDIHAPLESISDSLSDIAAEEKS